MHTDSTEFSKSTPTVLGIIIIQVHILQRVYKTFREVWTQHTL